MNLFKFLFFFYSSTNKQYKIYCLLEKYMFMAFLIMIILISETQIISLKFSIAPLVFTLFLRYFIYSLNR